MSDDVLVVWIPGRLTNPLNGAQGGWQKKARLRREWGERTALCVKDAFRRMPPGSAYWDGGSPKHVLLTAFVWNLFDEDGLAAALKPIVDGLVRVGVIHADDPKSGHRFERRQRIDRECRGVEVAVEPLPPAAGARP